MTKSWDILATRIQLLLRRYQLHLGKTNTTWVIPLDLSIFLSIVECVSSDQHIERNQRRHILLPSSIWSLDHWQLPISSTKVMNTPSISHSEFLQKFSHQLLSNVEHTLNILELCVLNFGPWWMAAFIDEGINIPHINTFVLHASIENVVLVADIPNFFCKQWNMLLM